jgi:hypothetical protein
MAKHPLLRMGAMRDGYPVLKGRVLPQGIEAIYRNSEGLLMIRCHHPDSHIVFRRDGDAECLICQEEGDLDGFPVTSTYVWFSGDCGCPDDDME